MKRQLLRTAFLTIGVYLSGCANTQEESEPSQIETDQRYGEFMRQAQERLQKGQMRTDSSRKQCERAKADLIAAKQKGNQSQIKANTALIELTCDKS